MGWDKTRLLRGDLTEHSAEETAAFLQIWLYFGVMPEALQIPIRREDFVFESSGSAFVTTKKLPGLIASAQKSMRMKARISSLAGFWSLLSKAAVCLQEVRLVLRYHVWYHGQVPPASNRVKQDALPDEILLSILVLMETVDATYSHFTNPIKPHWFPCAPDIEHDTVSLGIPPLLLEKLRRFGYCWNDIDRLVMSCDNSTLCYASTLHRSSPTVDHGDCSMQSCTANNIDEYNYVTRHAPECIGDCLFRGPDPKKLKGIIRQGWLPVVRITTRPGTAAIEVKG
ncbi:putative Heterokaryon incompatibility domain-containing protein [Seiridium unicorne]|uniref:Heterokaryon incompatibility domain-containing protein n=1 Tax=Seiridium unicorne TaxID=138068 RepID=A0ABR2URA8_9PEZI